MSNRLKEQIFQAIGVVGTVACFVIFVREPSFPTPDKLFVVALFIAMMFRQATKLFMRLFPFIALLLVYESLRGLAPYLNTKVNFMFMIHADKALFFGQLPTVWLQKYLWHGHVMWYDFVLYLAYMLHFVLPLILAVVIWKKREREYMRYITTYVLLSFAGFITYVLFPAAPPWMAAEKGLLGPMTRISSQVFASLGIHDFPSLYNKISPNAVAAVPSLHAAYATLFALFVTKLFIGKWRYFSWIYPAMIWFGTVYQGEHYAIDAILGILYALAAYSAAPYVLRPLSRFVKQQHHNLQKMYIKHFK